MKRHYIRLGAQTTAQGVVVSASGVATIEGKAIAVQGDLVSCKTCHSTGYIICDGPHHNAAFFGKTAALENDICACKCYPHPRLLANQHLAYQEYEGQDATWTPAGDDLSAATAAEPDGAAKTFYDAQFQLVDADTGQPLAQHEYALRRGTGELESGLTDAEGLTHRVSVAAEAEFIEIYAVADLELA